MAEHKRVSKKRKPRSGAGQSERNGSARRHKGKEKSHAGSAKGAAPSTILVVDIGGTKVKILATGETKPRKALTGLEFTPERLVATIKKLAHGWEYDALTIGVPGPVGIHGPQSEPGNLGTGWVGFDYASAFGMPVKVVNDAVMQALGSYEHGRMVFVGFGTGVGSALIADNIIVPMELGHLLYDQHRTFNDVLSRAGLRRFGKKVWRRAVDKIVPVLMRTFHADYVVLGGGNAKNVKRLPVGARMGHNLTAFRGGIRVWKSDPPWVLAMPANGRQTLDSPGNKILVEEPFHAEK